MLEKEFQHYLDNQKEFVEKYNGQYIVIVGKEVVGVFNDELEAYEKASANHGPGKFLLQHVSPGDEDISQTFHSRVYFGETA